MRLKAKTILIIFIAMLILPSILYFVFYPFFDKTNNENRTLAEKPIIRITSIAQFPRLYDNYFNDNLPFRNQIIRAKSYVDYKFLHIVMSNRVLRGKGNWLFYDETISDYKGNNIYTKEQLTCISENLQQMQDYLSDKGIEFYLFIAPNKSSVYTEFMPDFINTEGVSNKVKQLIEYLRLNTDIPIIYPLNELKSYKDRYLLYYFTDTHWNSLGGFIGSQMLLKTLGMESLAVEDFPVNYSKKSGGDLAKMLNLSDLLGDTETNLLGFNENYNMEYSDNIGNYQITSSNNSNDKTLFMIRDSFSLAMISYLAPEFRRCIFVHRDIFDNANIEKENPDVVVYEIVERYSDQLLKLKINR